MFHSPPKPGSPFFSMLVSPEEYRAIALRGYATLDGVKAFLVAEASEEESGFARFNLEKPYERTEDG